MKMNPNSQLAERQQQHPSFTSGGVYLPSLPLEAWAATKDTLHLWLQVVGKIKLAYMPPRNHWWQVEVAFFHLLDRRHHHEFGCGRAPRSA